MIKLVPILVAMLLASGPALGQPAPPPWRDGPPPYYRHDHPQHRLAHWYAAESMRQVEEGRRMGCGFVGQSWALDWELHYRWALRANPNRVYRQVEDRDRHLARCRSNKLRQFRQPPR